MSTLSQFFGSASTGGGASNATSVMRVFTTTGSLTLPSNTVYVAYGALGGGGQWSQNSATSQEQRRSGGGGGFAFKEGEHSGSATVCAIVGAAGQPCECCLIQRKTQGGTSCVSGFTPGTICATNGCCFCAGCGVGGDINTCGGRGAYNTSCGGGAGAGGLFGNGGSPNHSSGGGGYGSGGGGGAGRSTCVTVTCADAVCFSCNPDLPMREYAEGGGGGQAGSQWNGGSGLAGIGGRSSHFGTCANCGVGGLQLNEAQGGYIPQYTICGYSQAKTYFAAAGGGGGTMYAGAAETLSKGYVGNGAPGGGGGGHNTHCTEGSAGQGGFGAGGGGGTCGNSGGLPGFGGGSSTNQFEDGSSSICGGPSGQGVVAVEYWVG